MGIGRLIFLQIHRALKHDGGSLARLPTAVSFTRCRKELFFFFFLDVVVEEEKKNGPSKLSHRQAKLYNK